MEVVRKARRESGLDPDGIRYGVYLNVACHPDIDAARNLVPELAATAAFQTCTVRQTGL